MKSGMGAAGVIPDEQWKVYQRVIREARAGGIPFALGGAFAFANFTGLWRDTKDLDLYILPKDRAAMIEVLSRAGMRDYYERLPYDRNWIYRSYSEGTIVDIIWAMANQRAVVDETWIFQGPEAGLNGERLRAIPPEEMLWAKLYIVQRDRCDWPDVLNLIYAKGDTLDWDRVIANLGPDAPLLKSALEVFGWLAPGRTRALPRRLWERLGLPVPEPPREPEADPARVRLLDSRPWFA
jgi:hypothetical protein